MDPESFRDAGHRIVDLLADYLASIEAILTDYRALVEPNANHWSHPGFMAWFPSANAAPGILGEFLTAGIGQNTFLWRTSPVGTELEAVVVGWLREALGLPDAFDGFFTDTASTCSHRPSRSAMSAMAAAGSIADVFVVPSVATMAIG